MNLCQSISSKVLATVAFTKRELNQKHTLGAILLTRTHAHTHTYIHTNVTEKRPQMSSGSLNIHTCMHTYKWNRLNNSENRFREPRNTRVGFFPSHREKPVNTGKKWKIPGKTSKSQYVRNSLAF